MEEGCGCLIAIACVAVAVAAYAAGSSAADIIGANWESITGFFLKAAILAIFGLSLGGGWFLAFSWWRSKRLREEREHAEVPENEAERQAREAQALCDKLNGEGYETEPYYDEARDEWLIRVFTVPDKKPSPKKPPKPQRSDLE